MADGRMAQLKRVQNIRVEKNSNEKQEGKITSFQKKPQKATGKDMQSEYSNLAL